MKKKNRWWLLITPLYLFTLLFVLGPMIYMVAGSFATNNGEMCIRDRTWEAPPRCAVIRLTSLSVHP